MADTSAVGSFASFFQQWLVLHEDYIRLLEARFGRDGTAADDDDGLESLVLDHYRRYYKEKSRAAEEEGVLQFFTPPWLSRLEQAFLWVGGWKPTLAFRLLRRLKRPLLPERLGSPEVVKAAWCGGRRQRRS